MHDKRSVQAKSDKSIQKTAELIMNRFILYRLIDFTICFCDFHLVLEGKNGEYIFSRSEG